MGIRPGIVGVTHGICDTCKDRQLAKVREAVAADASRDLPAVRCPHGRIEGVEWCTPCESEV
jgi:hypothetical protein